MGLGPTPKVVQARPPWSESVRDMDVGDLLGMFMATAVIAFGAWAMWRAAHSVVPE